MIRKVRAALVALAIVFAALAAAPAPAAHAALSDCPDALLCTFWDWDFQGAVYWYSSPTGTCIEIGEPWDNDTSSIANKRSIPVRFYVSHGCVPNGWDVSIPANGRIWELALCCQNDRMSSFWLGWSPPGGLNY